MSQTVRFMVAILHVSLASAFCCAAQQSDNPYKAQDCGRGAASEYRVTNRQGSAHPSWTVRYESGTLSVKPGQWLRISFVPRAILPEIANPVLSVPAEQFVSFEFSAKAERASHLMQGARSGCSYARGLMPDASDPQPALAIATLASLGSVSRFAESLNAKHAVRFVWSEAGEQRSIVVKVIDCEYQSLIANTKRLLGSRWPEVGRDTGH